MDISSPPPCKRIKLENHFLKVQENFRLRRHYSCYVVNTWEKFHNPLDSTVKVQQVVSNLTHDLDCKKNLEFHLSQIGQKIQKVNLNSMVKHHLSGTDQNPTKKQLGSLLRTFVYKVIGPEMVGGAHNHAQLVKNSKLLFTSGKGSPIYIDRMVHNFHSISLDPKVFLNMMAWIGENLLWRLIKSYLHITETTSLRNELVFYHKRHFQSLLTGHFSNLLKSDRIKEMSKAQIARIAKTVSYAPGLARCRLLPKKDLSSMRLIARKDKRDGSRHQQEAEFRHLLVHAAKVAFPHVVDVKGITFHKLWSQFMLKVRPKDKKVYVVAADIRDAFGSVLLPKLAAILAETAAELPNQLYCHTVRYKYPNSKRVLHKTILSVEKNGSELKNVIPTGCNRIVSPGQLQQPKLLDTKKCFKMITKRCRLHTMQLRMGQKRRHFLVTRGLVQGDTLSSPLCDIYYGHLVKTQLSSFKSDGEEKMFARGMDDFIFATTDFHEAQRFLDTMKTGFDNYGCIVQAEKTVTNFEVKELEMDMQDIVFCGARVHPVNLSCRPDFSGYFGRNIAFASTFTTWAVTDKQAFIDRKMLFVCNLKMKPLYLDETLNGAKNVLANLYEMHYVTALRLHSLLASLYFQYNEKPTGLDILFKKISTKVGRTYDMVCKKYKLQNVEITRATVEHLLRKAFYQVVKVKHGSFYKDITVVKKPSKKSQEDHYHHILHSRNTVSIISRAYQRC